MDKNLHKQDQKNTFARDVMIIDTNKNINGDRQFSDDSEIVLSVKGVSKKFCRNLKRSLFYGVQDIASDLTGIRSKSDRLRPKEFWALDDVSLQLRKGEALGLVGKNGSGKSTLLRIIAGLIKPDLGTVEVKGRLAPLIALGAGFNPILTGRENIYANMAILGLSKKEIDERFDDVVEFAEIGEAIDAPVQTYSSGMAARLGFASAIHTEPDILLIDEVLAVGDIKFQAKCHLRLAKLRERGTTFILVSHNPQVILGVCDSALYLVKGQAKLFSDVTTVIVSYEKDLFLGNSQDQYLGIFQKAEKSSSESLGLDIISLSFKDLQGKMVKSLRSGDKINLEIQCIVHRNIQDLVVRINFYEVTGGSQPIQFISNINDEEILSVSLGKQRIVVQMPYFCFKPGLYDLKIVIREGSLKTLDFVESFRFSVSSDTSMHTCAFYQPHSWKILDNLDIIQ